MPLGGGGEGEERIKLTDEDQIIKKEKCISFKICNTRGKLSLQSVYDNKTTNYYKLFYVHVTVHRNKFICNKIEEMHQFHKFIVS